MGKVTAMKMDPITDKSGHQMVGMAVSVCTTPAAPSPIPIPYPTVGTVMEGVSDVAMRTKVSGNKVVTVGSLMNKCHGNEPGTLKEVVSLNTAGPCFPALGAIFVICELGMMGITGSIGQMNKSISPGGGGSASGAGGNAGGGGGGGGGAGSPSGQSGQSGSNSGGGGGGSNSGAAPPSPGSSSAPAAQHTCQNGHPVDVVSGCVVDEQVDFALPGTIPFQLKRFYNSRRRDDLTASMGPGWGHNLDQRIETNGDVVHLRDEEGRWLTFQNVREGESTFHKRERMWLHGERQGFRVERLNDRLTYRYERFVAGDPSASAMLTRVEDRRGNTIRLRYDHGRVSQVVDTAGRQINVSWTRAGGFDRISGVRVSGGGQAGIAIRYQYDGPDGCLARVTDACRQVEEYAYDTKRRMASTTMKNGVTFHYEYDDATDRCVHTWGPKGLYELTFEYDLDNARTIAHGEEPRIYDWNGFGRMTREATPSGIVLQQRAFDQDGYLIADTDGAGQGTRYWYDELGNVTRVVDADDNETRFEYAYGRPVKRITPDGLETTYQYDDAGLLVGSRQATGATFSVTRDERGRVLAIDGPFGRMAAYEYDNAGNIAAKVDGRGQKTTFGHDGLGRPTSRTDAKGRVTRVAYDARGRRTSIQHPDGTTTQLAYDELDGLRERTDRLGRTWHYKRAGMGVLVDLTGPAGAKWKLTYTSTERLKTVTDPAGATYAFEYDQAGRIVRETTFDGRTQAYLYDAAGNVEEVQYDDGSARAFAYDVRHRLIEAASTDQSTRTTYHRDKRGRLLGVTLREGAADVDLRFERDAFGRIVAEHQGEQTIRHEWDVLNRRTARHLPEQHTTHYHHDGHSELAAIVHGLADRTSHRLDFDRDPVGAPTRMRTSIGRSAGAAGEEGTPYAPRFAVDHEYDAMDRLVGQRVRAESPSSDVRDAVTRRYHYDAAGRATRIEDQRWGTTTLAYDPQDRLVALTRGAHHEAFEYDAAGGIEAALEGLSDQDGARRNWTLEAGNRLVDTEDATYAYDARGRRVQKTEKGAEGEERVTKYVWDPRDRLREVLLPDGDRMAFHYDPLGRRSRKERYTDSGALAETTHFMWDGDTLCGDRVEGEAARVFVHHPTSGLPLLQVERGEVFTCVCDQVGVVRELIDTAGKVAWAGSLSAWGKLLDSAADETSANARGWAVSSPFRLMGQYHDAETGLSCTRHRYFDAETARWCSPDPIGLAGGTNLFGFNRAPSIVMDPLGLSDGGPHGMGAFPPGSTIVDDQSPSHVTYRTADGEERMRFRASDAVTAGEATPGRNNTVDTLVGLNDNNQPYVHEGRHRAIGAAQGDTVHPSNGGVADAPGYLDYEYTDDRTPGGVPVSSLSIDQANDGTRDQAIADWEQTHGMKW